VNSDEKKPKIFQVKNKNRIFNKSSVNYRSKSRLGRLGGGTTQTTSSVTDKIARLTAQWFCFQICLTKAFLHQFYHLCFSVEIQSLGPFVLFTGFRNDAL
jgi:hypothetical protein